MPLHRRLPKRGFNNIFRKDFVEVGLDRIAAAVEAGVLDASKTIDAEALKAAGVDPPRQGRRAAPRRRRADEKLTSTLPAPRARRSPQSRRRVAA